MKVTVDREKCIGCGVCVDIADRVFRLEDGLSKPINEGDLESADLLEAAKSAVEICPVQAISIEK